MGVKGLQYYVEHCCPSACETVSIKQMVVYHRRNYPDSQPTIVVDGMSLLHRLYQKLDHWIYGAQWRLFCAVLKDFVQRFDRIGIKLVFFFDGTVERNKMHEWIDRRLKNISAIEALFDFIKLHKCHPPSDQFQLPTAMGSLTRLIIKCLIETEVYNTTREADLEIAEYAKNHDNVFAILGQDSDFMIFDTKPYLSAAHLNLDEMTTIHYDRYALVRHLSLSTSQLPLLSCIMGNDIIPVDLVKPFHRTLCRRFGGQNTSSPILLPLVRDCIKREGWIGDVNDEQELMRVSAVALGDRRNYKLLVDGLRSYQISTGSNIQPASTLQERFISCEITSSLYHLSNELLHMSGELIEDPKGQNHPPAALIYRPLRRRLYSILTNNRQVVFKELCAYPGNRMEAPESVTPIPLANIAHVCSLEELWDESPDLYVVKFEHFLGCLGTGLQLKNLCKVPKHYVVLVSVLNYMLSFEPTLLQSWEVVAFLVQGISLKNISIEDLREVKVPRVEARAVHLGNVFMRGVYNMIILLGACGYPIPLNDALPVNFFDGKLFHATYIRAAQNCELSFLCSNQKEVSEVEELFSITVEGTAVSKNM